MPDEPAPESADGENNTPEAPPPRPAPLQDRDKADMGCLMMMLGAFGALFFVVPFLWFFPVIIIPALVLFLLVLVTPFINPTEKMADGPRWTGRLITWLVLALLAALGYYFLMMRAVPVLRE
jgi:hypothetical protein